MSATTSSTQPARVRHGLLVTVACLSCVMSAAVGGVVRVTDSDSGASFPATAIGSTGVVYVVWQDDRGLDGDIYGQAYAPDGTALWARNGVALVAAAKSQRGPVVVADASGGVIVAWMDARNGAADIYAQRFDAEGTPSWKPADGVPVAVMASGKDDLTICADGQGGCFLAWEDWRAGNQDILGQHLASDGSARWAANGAVVCDTDGHQYDPVISADGVGGVVVAWWDVARPYWRVGVQRVSATGELAWGESGAAVSEPDGNQAAPQIVGDGIGGAYIFWVDYRNDDGGYSNFDLFAQHVVADGGLAWGEAARPLCVSAGTQQSIHAISDGDGGAYITWTDERDLYDDVYAQRVTRAGSWAWQDDGVPVCTQAGRQRDPKLGRDDDSLLVAWYDYRRESDEETPQDIYVQRLDGDGARLMDQGGERIVTEDGARLALQAHARHGRVAITWMDRRDNGSKPNVHAWFSASASH